MGRVTVWLPAVAMAVVLAACHQSRDGAKLESRNAAVSATYEVHRDLDFTAFLETQPEGSVDALIIDAMPPPIIVLAKVSLTAKPADSPHLNGFTTTLSFSDGSNVSKRWKAASGNKGSGYRAIFGVSKDVVRAETVLAPAP